MRIATLTSQWSNKLSDAGAEALTIFAFVKMHQTGLRDLNACIGLLRFRAQLARLPMSEHEWIEVKKRRWCIRCNCFQQKPRTGMKFWTAPPCANIYNKDRPRPVSDILEFALSSGVVEGET